MFISQRFGLYLKSCPLLDENYIDAAAKIVIEIVQRRPVNLFGRLDKAGDTYITQGIVYCCSPALAGAAKMRPYKIARTGRAILLSGAKSYNLIYR